MSSKYVTYTRYTEVSINYTDYENNVVIKIPIIKSRDHRIPDRIYEVL
jgi:hypothetical protein